MVRLLKRLASQRIQNRMLQYFLVTLGVGSLFILCTLGFHLAVAKQYDSIMDQSLCLNRFYFQLEEQNNLVKDYWQTSASSMVAADAILRQFDELDQLASDLEIGQFSAAYHRNLRDIGKLLDSYQSLFSSLSIQINALSHDQYNLELLSQVNQTYFEMQEIYEIIYSDFHYLQLSMMDNSTALRTALHNKTVAYFVVLICALSFLVICGMIQARNLTDQVAKPILTLANSAQMIMEGKIDQFQRIPVDELEPGSEITLLTNAFNLMIERLSAYIQETEENARTKVALAEQEVENLRISNLLRSSELKALQMQINPHFLFNTLNMIAQTAYVGDSDTTVFLLGKTAELLRYSLGSMGKAVTLAREIAMLGNYIYLQEQRMGDRIEFEFDLDERFHQMQVPCLILQPLVENAVVHGVGKYTENGKVLIRTRYDSEHSLGIISICDNGLGMTQERMEEIRGELSDPNIREKPQSRIGLTNVYMRLQVMYDGQAKLEFSSIPKEMTEIRLSLPCQLPEGGTTY